MAQSATTSGAIKQYLEAQGLNISVYRDRAPEGTALPYVTVDESLATAPDPLEDGAVSTGRELVQLNVYDNWKGTTGAIAERYTLVDNIVEKLHGVGLPAARTRAYAILVQRVGPRSVDEQSNIVRTPLTASIRRQL